MKPFYKKISFCTFLGIQLLFFSNRAHSQCNCPGGSTPQTIVHTKTITTSMEVNEISFPQFDPSTGILVCVDVNAEITAITRIRIENDEMFAADYRISYSRTSTIEGPGLDSTLVSSYSKGYGPYSLDASDGVYFSGPDYYISNWDTVLNKKKLTQTVNADVTPFMGSGTVTYNYYLRTISRITGGGNYLGGPLTRDIVSLSLTYNYCPNTVLASGIQNFTLQQTEDNHVQINWEVENELAGHGYEAEVSSNSRDFTGFATVMAQPGDIAKYSVNYSINSGSPGTLYFRIKKSGLKGISYSAVKSIRMGKEEAFVRLFPNPATDKLMLRFTGSREGDYFAEIFNSVGHVVKTARIANTGLETFSVSISDLPQGLYFITLSGEGGVKQVGLKFLVKK